MKVLHVIWDLDQGGAQMYVCGLLKSLPLVNRDIECDLVVLGGQGPLSDLAEKSNAAVTYIGMRNGYDLRGASRLCRFFKSSCWDLVHSHSHNPAFNKLVQCMRVPKVFTEHGGGLTGGKWRQKLFYRLFAAHYDHYIAISQAMVPIMQKACPEISGRIDVIHNGVDIAAIESAVDKGAAQVPQDVSRANYRVGVIGRLVEQKGIDMFLEVAMNISAKRQDIVFVVVGDGPLRGALESQAVRQGLSKRVFFLGYRRDAWELLRWFDIFLFTSNYEPFGLVLAEAMAAGVPVIARHVTGAVPEIITNGRDGVVVEGKDTQELAKAVLRVLKDEQFRLRIISSARTKVKRDFSLERNATKVAELYSRLHAKSKDSCIA